MRFNYRTLIVWLFIAVLAFVAISLSRMTESAPVAEINMTEFRQYLMANTRVNIIKMLDVLIFNEFSH